eukprot:7908086-Pyramimonas_sp.AAC.1
MIVSTSSTSHTEGRPSLHSSARSPSAHAGERITAFHLPQSGARVCGPFDELCWRAPHPQRDGRQMGACRRLGQH